MDLHIIHFKPIAVLHKTVFSEREFSGEGSWDAFLPYHSKSKFFEPPYNPLQADCSSEQNGFLQKGSLANVKFPELFQGVLQAHGSLEFRGPKFGTSLGP